MKKRIAFIASTKNSVEIIRKRREKNIQNDKNV